MKRVGFVESNRSGSGFDALRADAAKTLARADRVRELIKARVAASAPAGEVVA